ncbi:ROK family transcriptional regulator [Aeromicrobium camelliae]|uniref:ROK family transcriptional regulator n=1 Tax=Aeromicrobium camelliae TaxID=1538144 RepID=A0A3N6WXH8_9ACTN|nr:ROK family transcriptional regulator [Aeromicrobium camelliae]RQN09742.1 ROK family transcriptional regulator [Aeromicrobium camelliae]
MTGRHTTAALRAQNRRLVFEALQHGGEVSQAEIARSTSLAPATVSNIVKELVAGGVVDTVAGAGRRGAVVRVARSAGIVAGVDFGHAHVRVCLADLGGTILGSELAPLDNDHDYRDGLKLAQSMLERLVEQLDTAVPLRSVGVGLPAPISADGIINSGSILPGWIGVDAQLAVSELFGVPARVDNDANLGALAEYAEGAGRGVRSMAYLKISSGIGAGLVLDGKIFRGGIGTAGELGHLTMDEDGPLCRCGSRGCLEAYAGGTSLTQQFSSFESGLTVREFVSRAVEGDLGARRLIEDAGRHLGRAAAALAQILGPELIVVGGDMAEAGELLLAGVRDGLRRHALEPIALRTEVARATLGDRSPAVGAVRAALEAVTI